MMKMKKEKFFYFLERGGPELIGIVGGIIILIIMTEYGLGSNFEKILDSAIVFSSIIVGFMGALLGILYSMSDTRLLQRLFEYRECRGLLKSYFARCITSGIVLVAITIALYLKSYFFLTALVGAILIWGFLLTYTFACTYRIMNIMLHIIFLEDKSAEDHIDVVTHNEEEVERLKRECRSKN